MYHVAVKSPTFSFSRIKGADPIIGVEMTSTGEVACLDYDYPSALFKALKASGLRMPTPGKYVLITVPDEEKARATELARRISKMDYRIVATRGTAEHLSAKGVENVQSICKVAESNHSLINLISKGEIGLVINVPSQADRTSIKDGFLIRRTASEFLVPVFTRMETAEAIVDALEKARSLIMPIRPLDEYLPRSSSQLV